MIRNICMFQTCISFYKLAIAAISENFEHFVLVEYSSKYCQYSMSVQSLNIYKTLHKLIFIVVGNVKWGALSCNSLYCVVTFDFIV